jgi:hypothetical protein
MDLGIVKVASTELDILVGQYELGDGALLTVAREGEELFLSMGPERVRLHPTSPTTFLVLDLSSTIEFVVDGSVVRGFILHLPQGDVEALRVEAP